MNWIAPEAAAEHRRERLERQRLGKARDALEQHVAAGQQADEQPLEHRVLADDHALDLAERLLQRLASLLARLVDRLDLGHLSSVWSFAFVM